MPPRPVVGNEAKFSKFVHKETHAGSGRSDHLRKGFLADLGDNRFRFAFLAEVRQQQEHSCKTFLARIEQLIDEIGFDADGAAEKVGNEHLGERWFFMDHADNSRLFYSGDDSVRHGRDRRDALHLPGKTSFAEEVVRSEYCDDCLLALLRDDGDLHLAFLDVENRIAIISLRKDDLTFAVLADAVAVPDPGEK